jgi:hypothetical protein
MVQRRGLLGETFELMCTLNGEDGSNLVWGRPGV